MKILTLFATLLLMAAPQCAWPQAVIGKTATVTTVPFTLSIQGAGTGSVSSSDGLILNCSSGSCTAAYSIGASITVTPTATFGSTFNWSFGTGGAQICSGGGTGIPCTFTIGTTGATLSAVFGAAGGTTIGASPFFVLDINSSSSFPSGTTCGANFATCINVGALRVWDTPNGEWTSIETSAGVYNFSILDTILANAASNSVRFGQWALARTPNFYSSNTNLTVSGTESAAFTPGETATQAGTGITTTVVSNTPANVLTIAQYTGTATNAAWLGSTSGSTFTPNPSGTAGIPAGCSYFTNGQTQPALKSGQCAPPNDLNADGTGANLHWKNWVAAAGSHVLLPAYINGTGAVWGAGGTSCPGINPCPHAKVNLWEVWNEPDTAKFWTGTLAQLHRLQDDAYCILKGSPTTAGIAFTIAATGDSCATVRASVTSVSLSGPIDPTVTVAMPSYHTLNPALTLAQNYLYCNASPPANCGGGAHTTTDIINFHMKAGNSFVSTSPISTGMEAIMTTWVSTNVPSILQAAELAKPLFNTEGGYAAAGWVAPYTDPNMEASFVARSYLFSYYLGVRNNVWYNWAPGSNGLGSSNANLAYSQVYNWMVGSTTPSCSIVGTVWTCTFNLANGVAAAAIWDIGQTCSGTPSVCTTSTQTVSGSYLTYLDLAGDPPTTINASTHQVPVSIMPIQLQAQ